MKTIHPAIAEHVMEENARLRGLLTTLRISLNLDDTEYGLSQQEKRKLAADIDAALSKQAEPVCQTMQRPKAECGCPDCGSSLIDWPTSEPTDTYTAVDMATAAAQGFRDGQAAVEPAPAQDEREAHVPDKVFQDEFQVWWEDHGQFCRAGGGDYERTFAFQAWRHLYPMLLQARATRPAQTEQQPVAVVEFSDFQSAAAISGEEPRKIAVRALFEGALRVGDTLYAAPIAQTAPQPEQEPFWYAVVSEQAPTINSAIKRLDVAQEFADSKRERWPDTRVVPLYATPQQSGLVEALRLCIASLDQLLPYLAKVPADIGLLNEALMASRAALSAQGASK